MGAAYGSSPRLARTHVGAHSLICMLIPASESLFRVFPLLKCSLLPFLLICTLPTLQSSAWSSWVPQTHEAAACTSSFPSFFLSGPLHLSRSLRWDGLRVPACFWWQSEPWTGPWLSPGAIPPAWSWRGLDSHADLLFCPTSGFYCNSLSSRGAEGAERACGFAFDNVQLVSKTEHFLPLLIGSLNSLVFLFVFIYFSFFYCHPSWAPFLYSLLFSILVIHPPVCYCFSWAPVTSSFHLFVSLNPDGPSPKHSALPRLSSLCHRCHLFPLAFGSWHCPLFLLFKCNLLRNNNKKNFLNHLVEFLMSERDFWLWVLDLWWIASTVLNLSFVHSKRDDKFQLAHIARLNV